MKEMLEISTFFGKQTVSSYLFFMIFAVIMAMLISVIVLVRFNFRIKHTLPIMLVTTILFFAGSRMLYVITHIHYYSEKQQRVWEMKLSGFSMLGGLLLATLGCFAISKIIRIDFWRLTDLFSPGLGIAIVLAKIGCFLNGCCFGTRSDLPWAVHFPYDSSVHKYYLQQAGEKGIFSLTSMLGSPGVHPVQLYEAMGAMIATLFAIVILIKKMSAGLASLSAAVIFIMTRLITFYFRAPVAMDETPVWSYPLIYIILLVVTMLLIRMRLKCKSNTEINV